MAEGKVLTGAGLRGQVAGKTALSTVGKSGAGLTYRGYDVQDLAENCQFEEVAYLIFFGELPTAEQLASYKNIRNSEPQRACGGGSGCCNRL